MVSVDETPLYFFEFTHVVAAPGVPHDLLIPILARQIVQEARCCCPPVIVFAETIADVPALQQACAAVGMQPAGTMVQSFRLQAIREAAPVYHDAHVWYTPIEAEAA